MDLVSNRHFLLVSHGSQAFSPIKVEGPPIFHSPLRPSNSSFPIIAIIVIGITSTIFLLVSYYIFVIKCCLNRHRIDLVRPFSLSRRYEEPVAMHSPRPEPQGLEEAVIRSIPVIQYKTEGNREFGDRSFCECAVCLNEFQEDEKLRIIPNCSHVFHIDCIDIWLQNNANCPLCRASISLTNRFYVDQQLPTPRPSPQDQSPRAENITGGGSEDFVVIELGNDHDRDQNLPGRQERANGLEVPTRPISPSLRKLEQRIVQKKARKLQKVTSMGDECIDNRGKDDHFPIQPIRRSFSMDSSGDRQFHLAVQEAMQQNNRQVNEVSSIEVCGGSGRAKRSLFSFGNGSRSRSAVLPV